MVVQYNANAPVTPNMTIRHYHFLTRASSTENSNYKKQTHAQNETRTRCKAAPLESVAFLEDRQFFLLSESLHSSSSHTVKPFHPNGVLFPAQAELLVPPPIHTPCIFDGSKRQVKKLTASSAKAFFPFLLKNEKRLGLILGEKYIY